MYTHTTFGALKTELSLRLWDQTKVFWVDAELGIHIQEALRTYGLCSGFWRERGTLTTSNMLGFYDINQQLLSGSGYPLRPTVTDRDIIRALEYHLLEPTASQSPWQGTETFTYQDLAQAVQNRLNQFLADTGVVVRRSVIPVMSPPIGRQPLDQQTVDIRRAAWIGASPFDYYKLLWREDERALTAASRSWSVSAATPEAYSVLGPPPLQVQLAPVPLSDGQLE